MAVPVHATRCDSPPPILISLILCAGRAGSIVEFLIISSNMARGSAIYVPGPVTLMIVWIIVSL